MKHRQQKLPLALRITAAGCIGLWLLVSSYCSIEHLFGDDHHHAGADASETIAHHDGDHSPEAEAAEHAHGEASDSHDSAQHSRDSHPHDDGDDACCSTQMATAQVATPFPIIKPILQPLDLLYPVRQTRDQMLSAPKDELKRQAKPRDWVFTPVVCLGPAFRSLAAPTSV